MRSAKSVMCCSDENKLSDTLEQRSCIISLPAIGRVDHKAKLYPEQQLVIPHAPAATQPVPFDQLNGFLERSYTRHRRARP